MWRTAAGNQPCGADRAAPSIKAADIRRATLHNPVRKPYRSGFSRQPSRAPVLSEVDGPPDVSDSEPGTLNPPYDWQSA